MSTTIWPSSETARRSLGFYVAKALGYNVSDIYTAADRGYIVA